MNKAELLTDITERHKRGEEMEIKAEAIIAKVGSSTGLLSTSRRHQLLPIGQGWIVQCAFGDAWINVLLGGNFIEFDHEEAVQLVLYKKPEEQPDMFGHKKRGGARPGAGRPLDGAEKKTELVQFLLTKSELAQLMELAEQNEKKNGVARRLLMSKLK